MMDPTRKSDAGALNAEDLKSHLYQSLHSSGLLKQLKGQLRCSMINELRGKGEKKFQSTIQSQRSDVLTATIKHKKSRSWVNQAIDNLVYLHLKQNGYQYSLSLFEQESCVDTFMPSLMDDLLQRLGLNSSDLDITVDTPASSLSEDFIHVTSTPTQQKDPGLALWKIFEKLSLLAASKPLNYTEKVKFVTEDDKPMTLGEKLKAVDEEMQLKVSQQARDPSIAISSYTAAVRRAEEDAERRAKAHFEQWRTVELVQLKMEEAKKTKDCVDRRTNDLEKDYQSKREALQNRERAAISRLQHQREMLEREMHDQRQAMLCEIDQIRTREEALHKQEQVIHEIELLKRDEIGLLRDQMEQTKPFRHAEKKDDSDRISPNHLQATTTEMKELQQQLHYKSIEMEQLKRELSQLKVELTSARRFNQCQADRENLMLRSHLDQLTRELHGPNTKLSNKSTATVSDGEEKLRQEVKKLKEERTEQDAQQRNLAQTLNEMKQALEDSNSALARLNGDKQNTPSASGQEKAPLALNDVISSYSQPPKRVSFREYEPVETSLHPALVSSGEFDDPSMDEHVASASVRLDLLQRLKDLEEQTHAVDEHYHRYLRTHYRNLEQQLNKQTKQSQSTSNHTSPSGKTRSPLRPNRITQKERLEDIQRDLKKNVTSPARHPFSLAEKKKPSSPIRITESGSLVSIDEPGKIDSSLELPQPSLEPAALQADLRDSTEKADRSKQGTSKLPDQAPANDLKLFMNDLEQSSNEEVTSSSSKTSSEPSRSPELNTARRVIADVIPQLEPKTQILHSHSLPPITAPRKLPSLSPPKVQSSPPKVDSSLPDTEEDSPKSRSRLSSHEKPSYSLEKSDRVYFGKSDSVGTSRNSSMEGAEQPHASFHQFNEHKSNASANPVEQKPAEDSDFDSEPTPVPAKRTSTEQPSLPSRTENLQFSRVRQIPDGSEASRSPSVVSEMSLPSFSSSTDNNPLFNLEKSAAAEVENPSSAIETESVSGRVNPVAKSERSSTSSDQFTKEEEAQMIPQEKKPKKNWGDFDLTNEDDISEALRFSDAVKPTLDFDDGEDEMLHEAEEIPVVVEDDISARIPVEEEKPKVDVFEMSDNPESFDSNGKEDQHDVKSDVSW